MNFEKLKASLDDINFYKKNIPNLFYVFSFWKKAYQEYQGAQEKRILPSCLLRKSEHDTSHYNTYAISLAGAIDPDLADRLVGIAQNLDLGEVRFMAHATNGFFPMVDAQGVSVDHPDIALPTGVHMYTIADTQPERIDCPCAVVIKSGAELKKWAIARTALA
ncbi:MAG: hypothetical protein V4627_08505 [Pseudomonadota bacterium]